MIRRTLPETRWRPFAPRGIGVGADLRRVGNSGLIPGRLSGMLDITIDQNKPVEMGQRPVADARRCYDARHGRDDDRSGYGEPG